MSLVGRKTVSAAPFARAKMVFVAKGPGYIRFSGKTRQSDA